MGTFFFFPERLLISLLTSIIIHHKSDEWTPMTPKLIPPSLIYYLRSRCMICSVHSRRRLVPWIRFLQNLFPNAWIFFFPQLLRSPTVLLSLVSFPSARKNALVFMGVDKTWGRPWLYYGLLYGPPYMAYRKEKWSTENRNCRIPH